MVRGEARMVDYGLDVNQDGGFDIPTGVSQTRVE